MATTREEQRKRHGQIVALLEDKMSPEDVAKTLGISTSSVYYAYRQIRGKRRGRHDKTPEKVVGGQNVHSGVVTILVEDGRDSTECKNPCTADRIYSTEELAFLQAVENYKKETRKRFLTHCEYLAIFKKLGYKIAS